MVLGAGGMSLKGGLMKKDGPEMQPCGEGGRGLGCGQSPLLA